LEPIVPGRLLALPAGHFTFHCIYLCRFLPFHAITFLV